MKEISAISISLLLYGVLWQGAAVAQDAPPTQAPQATVEQNKPQSSPTDTGAASPSAEPAQKAPANVETDILNIVKGIVSLRTKLLEIDQELTSAEGEEAAALMIRRSDQYFATMDLIEQFRGKAESYVSSGGNLNALLADYRDGLLSAGAALRAEVDQYVVRLSENNAKRDTLTAEGLKGYTQDTKQVDISLSLLSEYVEVVKLIEFNPRPSITYLKKNLPERASFLIGRLRLSTERREELSRALASKPDDQEIQAKLDLVAQKLKIDADSLQEVIKLAGRLEMDTSEYQTVLVKSTGEFKAEYLDWNVAKNLFHEWWFSAKQVIKENSVSVILKLIVFGLIMLLFYFLSNFVGRIVRRGVQSSKVNFSILLQDMIVSMASRAVLLFGFLVALAQMGISLGPVLAGLGVAGFIVGFALQDTLGNFAAGMMILIYRPYDVGDMVEAGGAFGKVKSMNIVSTTILTIDNQTLILPNSKIWGDVIKNVTAQTERRVDMVFGIGYADDITHAETVLNDIIEKHDKVLSEPEPIVKLHTLNESSVDFVVRPWVKTEDYWDVYWDVTRAVKMRFDAEGISIPFPQRDVHVYQSSLPEPPKPKGDANPAMNSHTHVIEEPDSNT